MLLPENTSSTPFACAALPCQGKLFVIAGGGGGSETLVYRAATNQWALAAPTPGGRRREEEGLLRGGGSGGKDRGRWERRTGIYDPESDTWREGKTLGGELERYEVVAAGGKVYVTEGWWWPFMFRPRGWVYETERDTWREMGVGMRDGWSGVSVAVGGRVFVIAEYGDAPVKVYDEDLDTWRDVKGGRFPRDVIKRPFSATGLDNRIYVASYDLNVAIGKINVVVNDLIQGKANFEVSVTWEVVEAPCAFSEFSPCSCQVLYA